jgi:adenine deaminase
MMTDLVSRESQLDISPLNGEIKTDIERDILKVAVITGGEKGMKTFVGLVKGFGMKKGAFVTSAVWDACALTIVGVNEQDMAEAANRVIALKGGTVVFAEGQVQTEIAFPICGLISEQTIETIAERLDDIQQKMTELGCPFSDAQLTLSILTTSAIPFLRISEEGLVDTKKGKVVDLIIS